VLVHFRCTERRTERCTEVEPAGCPDSGPSSRVEGRGGQRAREPGGVELGHCSIGELAAAPSELTLADSRRRELGVVVALDAEIRQRLPVRRAANRPPAPERDRLCGAPLMRDQECQDDRGGG
ncbi:hypothetical protein, partial [Pengzhenrongella sp.]|uniref:hypothetical protein n=1 Tax=Pengzhenrongella sp. TaxID=2888820 RepID=UPI002F929C3C